MRIASILLILTGMLLIAIARHQIRRARKLRTQNSGLRTFPLRLTAWTLTVLGFLAILLGFVIW